MTTESKGTIEGDDAGGAGPLFPADAAARERQLAAAQQITHIGSWEWDMRTNVVTWSDELYRIYGLPPRSQSITFEYFLSRLHPEDRDRVRGLVGAALGSGGRFAYPERILRPDGSVRELETLGEVAHGDAGEVIGLIGTCRDVTEERKREDMIRLYADIVSSVQIGLSVWKLDDASDAATLRLVAHNPAADETTGVALAPMTGKTLPIVLPYLVGTEVPALLADVARDGHVRELSPFWVVPHRTPRAFSAKAFPLPDRSVGLALVDVTVRERAQRVQAQERRTLELVAAGAPLAEVLAAIVSGIEELSPDTLGSVLLLDETGTKLRGGAAPSLPATYNAALDGAQIGPCAGSCGTAAWRREAVFVADVERDPLWADYRELVRPHGLRACWSTPIFASDGRVLGTFALYYREPRAPDDESRALIGRATHIAGIAIERRQLDDQLRALSAHVEAAREEERSGIAREIHDELGQLLTALKMDLAWTSKRLADPTPASVGIAREKLSLMSTMTDDLVHVVRRISSELRPGVLDDLGLVAAVEWQTDEIAKRTGLVCSTRAELGELHVGRALSTAVFRILQESLTNIVRHAEAKAVDVVLAADASAIRLSVSDDGIGIPALVATSPTALGLLGMRERARRLGGDVHVAPRRPRGTEVTVSIPLAGAAVLP